MRAIKKSNWRFIWLLPIFMLSMTAGAEIFQLEFIVAEMTAQGMAHLIVPLGIIKLICVTIFLLPKTRHIGFLLCTAYIGGILAAELILNEPPIPGILMQVLLWVGMYFERPVIFREKMFKFPIDE